MRPIEILASFFLRFFPGVFAKKSMRWEKTLEPKKQSLRKPKWLCHQKNKANNLFTVKRDAHKYWLLQQRSLTGLRKQHPNIEHTRHSTTKKNQQSSDDDARWKMRMCVCPFTNSWLIFSFQPQRKPFNWCMDQASFLLCSFFLFFPLRWWRGKSGDDTRGYLMVKFWLPLGTSFN